MTQDEINDEMAFRSAELGRVQGDRLRLKVESSNGDTRWLSITRHDFEKLTSALIYLDPEEWKD